MHTGFTLIELLVIMAVLGLLAALIHSHTNAETIELKTSEWICVKTEQRKYQYPQLIGKITIMQTGTRSECVEWRKP